MAPKKVKLARLQKETVDDLLSRGYSLEEVERIVFGQSNWDKFCGIFSLQFCCLLLFLFCCCCCVIVVTKETCIEFVTFKRKNPNIV